MFICANMLLDSVYGKDENFYPKVFLEIYYFIEDIEIYYSDSDEEYYNEDCINLLLETLTKYFFSLGLCKFSPEI